MLAAREPQWHAGMPQLLAAFIPLIIAIFGGMALTRSLRAPSIFSDAGKEQASTRRWLFICLLLMAFGPGVHGAISVMRNGAVPTDAIFGFWFMIPLSWFLYDWDRTWQRLLAEGTRQGYSVKGTASLLRFVTAGIVLMGFSLLFVSVSGTELPSRYPSHPAQSMKR